MRILHESAGEDTTTNIKDMTCSDKVAIIEVLIASLQSFHAVGSFPASCGTVTLAISNRPEITVPSRVETAKTMAYCAYVAGE